MHQVFQGISFDYTTNRHEITVYYSYHLYPVEKGRLLILRGSWSKFLDVAFCVNLSESTLFAKVLFFNSRHKWVKKTNEV